MAVVNRFKPEAVSLDAKKQELLAKKLAKSATLQRIQPMVFRMLKLLAAGIHWTKRTYLKLSIGNLNSANLKKAVQNQCFRDRWRLSQELLLESAVNVPKIY